MFEQLKRPIVVIGRKPYPVNGAEIKTVPKIPFEDYIFGRFDPAEVKVSHAIKTRGRTVPLVGKFTGELKRKSGRMVYFYEP